MVIVRKIKSFKSYIKTKISQKRRLVEMYFLERRLRMIRARIVYLEEGLRKKNAAVRLRRVESEKKRVRVSLKTTEMTRIVDKYAETRSGDSLGLISMTSLPKIKRSLRIAAKRSSKK